MNHLSPQFYSLGALSPILPKNGDYWVAPGARLVGNVTLEDGASVWFGSVLRADNEPINVGKETNIQEDCICHVDPGFPLIIGANCTIGHKAILHGCTIGDSSLIGMGATILNGAKIGRNCLIGAGALVTENSVVPDGTLMIGAPAKPKRLLTDDEILGLKKSAETYSRNKDRFKAELTVFTP